MKNKIVTIFAIFLILYGIVGALGSGYGIIHIKSWGIPNGYITNDLNQISDYLDDVSVSSRNAGNSFNNGARFIKSSGQSFKTVSSYVGFSVMGWQPFKKSYNYFYNGGSNLISLSNNFKTNANDMYKISDDVKEISAKVEMIKWKVDGVIYGILGFLMFHYLILGLLGVVLLKLR